MITRFALQIPAFWLGLGAVFITGHELFAGGLLALLLAATLAGPRLRLTTGVEAMLSSFVLLGAVMVAWLAPPASTLLGTGTPTTIHASVTLAALALATARALLERPFGGARGTVGIVIAGAVGLGGVRVFGVYGPFLVGLALASFASLRRADRGRVSVSSLDRRSLLFGLAVTAVAGLFIGLLVRTLPPLHDRAQAYALRALGFDPGLGRSGFSRVLGLGSLREIIRSNEKVLRVRGGHADHLRGIVYRTYADGRWFVPMSARPRPITLGDRPAAGAIEVEAIGSETSRLFVPLEARALAVPSGQALADEVGVLSPAGGEPADRVWFLPGPADRPPVAPPARVDLEVPPDLRPALAPLARRMTAGAVSDRSRLEAIRAALQRDYRYSLAFDRDTSEEPIVEFLFERKTGHCEYFASSMALLARTSSIPARVVGGFLVTEHNDLSDDWIVRQSNAHAWVEAWVDGEGWVTFDPTPPDGLDAQMAKSASVWEALSDLVSQAGAAIIGWIRRRTVTDLFAGVALGLLFLFRRELKSLFGRRSAEAASASAAYRPAWPQVDRMLALLAARGFARRPGESLTRFADRLEDREAAALLERYAAHRYGGAGDPDALAADLSRRCRDLQRPPR